MNILKGIGYTFLGILGFIGLGCLFGFLCFVYVLFVDLVNKTVTYFQEWESKSIQNKAAKLRASIHHITPDEHGYQGVVYNGETYLNLDSGEVIEHKIREMLEPVEEQIRILRVQSYEQRKRLTALAGTKITGEQAQAMLEAPQENLVQLPEYITLSECLQKYNHRPNIHNVFLGVSTNGPVVADMEDAVHALISGASGWGKSTLMESIAKQLVIGSDCDLAFIDYGVNTFGMLYDYGMYPVADSPEMAVALFRELIKEGNRRKELMREHPRAKTIYDYNQITGSDIRPIVCMVDESASLFTEQSTKGPITELAQMSRKFGMWLVLGGTDFKATTIPSSCTGNCGARIGFHLMPGLSRSLLNCTNAFELNQKGRALALIPGQQMAEIQCPIVSDWNDLPDQREQIIIEPPKDFDTQVKEAIEIVGSTDNISAICRQLGKEPVGGDFYKVRDAIDRVSSISTE